MGLGHNTFYMNTDSGNRINKVISSIKRLRLEKDYTQDYMAMKLNISQNAYSKLELGRSSLSLERLFQIAAVLETDISELFD